jgi:hypothetical protein
MNQQQQSEPGVRRSEPSASPARVTHRAIDALTEENTRQAQQIAEMRAEREEFLRAVRELEEERVQLVGALSVAVTGWDQNQRRCERTRSDRWATAPRLPLFQEQGPEGLRFRRCLELLGGKAAESLAGTESETD